MLRCTTTEAKRREREMHWMWGTRHVKVRLRLRQDVCQSAQRARGPPVHTRGTRTRVTADTAKQWKHCRPAAHDRGKRVPLERQAPGRQSSGTSHCTLQARARPRARLAPRPRRREETTRCTGPARCRTVSPSMRPSVQADQERSNRYGQRGHPFVNARGNVPHIVEASAISLRGLAGRDAPPSLSPSCPSSCRPSNRRLPTRTQKQQQSPTGP